MKLTIFALCALLLGLLSPVYAEDYSGTWTLEHSSEPGSVQLALRYQKTTASGNQEWDESRPVSWSDLHGVTIADLDSNGVHRSFSVVRDAGSFQAEGSCSHGHGAGIWTFAPSSSFNDQLRRRGIGSAT